MSTQYQKLLALLKELFQTDQADLDFGLYKVINQRRDEINRFLDEDLLPQVKAAFSEYQSVGKKSLEVKLAKAIKGAENLEVDPDRVPKVQTLREQIATYSVDVKDLENQVYSALFNFFRRYYDKGDFISQRRYKEGVYAIPYEGEEVKLYWANHNQYYIKTSEYLRDYTFKLPSGNKAHFKLVDADIEKDNRKEIDDKKRRFILAEEPFVFEDGELSILFEFRPDGDNRTQKKLNEQSVEMIFGLREKIDEQAIKDALAELAAPAPTESDSNRTLVAKNLDDYTRRNTQDYFIHKDLGKFLRRELDFFIKNEVMHLDNIENEDAPRVEQYLSKIKVIRQIAHKLIDFLAQIEDFQKKLWLKKKFVVETNYCITLDRIPEELYPEIAINDAQREEWMRLFSIDEIKADGDMFTVAYSIPLTVEFLKANPFLLVDTKFFDENFKYRLFTNLGNLDAEFNSVLIHSENFQALSLLQERYKKEIKCIYIDPPFNAKSSEILYKNNYKNSSWLSLMQNRIDKSKKVFSSDGTYIIAIDENEQENLGKLISNEFPYHKRTCVSVVHNPGGIQGKNFSYTHEFAYFIFPDDGKEYIGRIKRDEENRVPLRDWGGDQSTRESARNCFYPIIIDKQNNIIGFGDVCDDDYHPGNANIHKKDGKIWVYPIDSDGVERKWRNSRQSVPGIMDELICEDRDGEKTIIRLKSIYRYKTTWTEKKYSSNTYGTQLVNHIHRVENSNLYPKSIYTVMDSINAVTQKSKNSLVLDFFAGSGTTGHAVINLNREDGGQRKCFLVEMGQYFDTILKPRIQKVIYSEDWKDGKPVSRKGSSHAFKYIKLETYEDTLNNLELRRTEEQTKTLLGAGTFREDYLLHYMLDFESKDSLLELKIFKTPFDYELNIATSTVGETVPTKVDLVETFNYLIGLKVRRIYKIDGVVLAEGQTRDNKNMLIIWRNIKELDNEGLNAFFTDHFAERQKDFDSIFVNGDNNLANIRPQGATWNVHLTEEEFHYRMFENQET
jgi:adenine-specific DNA-methyltransferase